MRARDIVIGESYRLRGSPSYGYAKAIAVLKPGQEENTRPYIIVRCEHAVDKDGNVGFIRRFKPVDLVREKRP